jgi:hypothetical protein
MSQWEVVSFFRVIVVEVNPDDPRGKAAEMLGMIQKAEPMFACGVAKVVPVAKGGGGQPGEKEIPEVVRRNFPGILATLKAESEPEGGGLFAETEKNLLHSWPGFVEGLFQCADGRDLLPDEGPGAELALEGKGFERIRNVAWTGGTEMEDHEAGSDGGSGFQGGDGVALRKAAGGGAGIGKLVSIRVGAEEFDRHGTKIVEDIDSGGLDRLALCKNAGPKIEARVVTEFHGGETKIGGLSEEGGSISRAVGVPAGRKGKGGNRHAGSVSRKKKKRAKGFFEAGPWPGLPWEGVEESLSCGQYARDDGETDLL